MDGLVGLSYDMVTNYVTTDKKGEIRKKTNAEQTLKKLGKGKRRLKLIDAAEQISIKVTDR